MSPEYISAYANVVIAIGVVFAAGQLFVSKRSHTAQIEVHIVGLHTHFQEKMREIQKSFPPEVNEPSWQPIAREEKRAIRLYWYLVFDEWYTCKYLSNERRLNSLWDRYSHGVVSALRKPAFDAEVIKMFSEEAIFFGLGYEFSTEIENLRTIHQKHRRVPSGGS